MVVDSILHSFLRIDEPIAFNIAIVPENPMGAILQYGPLMLKRKGRRLIRTHTVGHRSIIEKAFFISKLTSQPGQRFGYPQFACFGKK